MDHFELTHRGPKMGKRNLMVRRKTVDGSKTTIEGSEEFGNRTSSCATSEFQLRSCLNKARVSQSSLESGRPFQFHCQLKQHSTSCIHSNEWFEGKLKALQKQVRLKHGFVTNRAF